MGLETASTQATSVDQGEMQQNKQASYGKDAHIVVVAKKKKVANLTESVADCQLHKSANRTVDFVGPNLKAPTNEIMSMADGLSSVVTIESSSSVTGRKTPLGSSYKMEVGWRWPGQQGWKTNIIIRGHNPTS
ncbi:Hypothetical predicted protein [Olea europaea subsp. europaea]|uniref:Uncharacterized protein n=1 Tax=Olea europaea subsp. europaea TaxID=158383 RepID=A0A8S0V0Y1_OLEEU|nr:Hypothetical predicted protein [Olea europaea subsp. europaea]